MATEDIVKSLNNVTEARNTLPFDLYLFKITTKELRVNLSSVLRPLPPCLYQTSFCFLNSELVTQYAMNQMCCHLLVEISIAPFALIHVQKKSLLLVKNHQHHF